MIQRFIAGDHGGGGRVVGLIALHQVSSDRLLRAGPHCPRSGTRALGLNQ
jgi:hypothetical protein